MGEGCSKDLGIPIQPANLHVKRYAGGRKNEFKPGELGGYLENDVASELEEGDYE